MLKEAFARMATRKKHVHVHYLLFALAQLATLPSHFHNLAVAHVYIQYIYRDDAYALDSALSRIEHKPNPSIHFISYSCLGRLSNH